MVAPLHTVRPHVGSRDPDDGIRRLHDRWRGALFEADVARTVKNRAPHVSLLCLAINSANLFAVLLVADLFERKGVHNFGLPRNSLLNLYWFEFAGATTKSFFRYGRRQDGMQRNHGGSVKTIETTGASNLPGASAPRAVSIS
jgi:hypothetical protein